MLEDYVVIDLEMTGLNAKTDAILEVGAVRVRDGRQTETYGAILKCGRELSERGVELTGITPEMAADGREPEEAMQEFFTFLGDDVLVGQNVIFDYSFLKQWSVNHGQTFERNAVDTLKLARRFLPAEQKKDLESLCTYFGIGRERAHRALDDAMATGIVSAVCALFPHKKTDARNGASDGWPQEICCALRHPGDGDPGADDAE